MDADLAPFTREMDIKTRLDYGSDLEIGYDEWVDGVFYQNPVGVELVKNVKIKKIVAYRDWGMTKTIRHENLLYCHDILDDGLCIVEDANVDLKKHINKQPSFYVDINTPTSQFKKLVTEMFNAICFLHAKKICHEHISLETTWFKDLEDGDIQIKLNAFIENDKSDLEFDNARRKDWSDFGRMLQELETTVFARITTNAIEAQQVPVNAVKEMAELRDLYNKLMDPQLNINEVKKTICSHPFFWTATMKTSMIVTFANELMSLSGDHIVFTLLRRPDFKIRLQPEPYSRPWTDLIEKIVLDEVNRKREHNTPYYDGLSIISFIRFMSNTIDYSNQFPNDITAIVGGTRSSVAFYLYKKQPKMFLAISELAAYMDLQRQCSFLVRDRMI